MAVNLGPSGVTLGTNAIDDWHNVGLVSVQVILGTGTWTKPSGISKVRVYVTGGGGSGGGGGANADFGAGGGAGGTAIKLIDVRAISTVSCTVGGGGAVNTASAAANGAAGGTSSFGSYCSATGGAGGIFGNAGPGVGGYGGSGSGGDINLNGGYGSNGWDNFTGNTYTWASGLSQGGASFWGGGAPGNYGGTNNPQHAPNPNVYGAGGGGAFYRTSGSWGNSGPGYQGCVIVEEYA
jgi:hypothetical protein